MFNGCVWRVYFVCYAAPHWLGEPKGWREYILVYCATTSHLYVFKDEVLTARINCIELHEAILFAGTYCTLTPRFFANVHLLLPHEETITDVNNKEEREKVVSYLRIHLRDDLSNKSNKIEQVLTQFTSRPSSQQNTTITRLLYNGTLVYIRKKQQQKSSSPPLRCCHSQFTVDKIDFLESAAMGLQVNVYRRERKWSKCLRCFFLASLDSELLIFPGLAVWLLNCY